MGREPDLSHEFGPCPVCHLTPVDPSYAAARGFARDVAEPPVEVKIICPRCQAQNPAGQRFCGQCGVRLTRLCTFCSSPNPSGQNFCGHCGTPVLQNGEPSKFGSPESYTPKHLAERILTTRSAIEGENKQVTVLFCDLANSTTIAERVGHEGMHDLLNGFFDIALGQVHTYEGTINQFLGDGFMALFGAPLAHEDHARRAVLAAVGLQRALGEQRAIGGSGLPELSARMGINTGLVTVGKIGDNLRMDYTAVGDTTNTAFRLQQLAEPGSILIGENTRQRVAEYVRTDRLGSLQVKGKSNLVAAHRLLGLGPRRSASEGLARRRLSPFVGRERELATFNELLGRVERGHGAAVGIVGEPGMGKSRLLLELRRAIQARRFTFLEARCASYGSAVPYALLLDILRSNCGILETDTPEATIQKVRFGLAEAGMDAEENSPCLLRILGIKDESALHRWASADAFKAHTFGVLRELSLRGSQRRPLIFALEDLHWSDKASEEFFTLLAESIPGAPILMVSTYRPGYSPPWIGRSYASQLALQPLAAAEALAIVGSIERPLAPSVAQIVVEKAEGNPFFLEELAQAVAERESGDATSSVPDTIHAVVSARIDRLPDQSKRLLQAASVIGREVPLSLLKTIWDGSGETEVHLRELTRSEFLYERASSEGPAYVFKHALTQEVVYASLLEARRRAYHGAIGASLERRQDGQTGRMPELLAHHFGLSNEKEKAVDYCLLAAENAQRRWAHREALAYFESALCQLDGMPRSDANTRRRVDAVVKQAEVKFALGRHAEHIAALEGIRELVATTDSLRQASWHFWLGFLHSLTGTHPTAAIVECRVAVQIATAEGFDEILACAESCLAQAYTVAGDAQAALDLAEHALGIFEAQRNAWWMCRTLWILICAANVRGEWLRSLAYGRRALEAGRNARDVRLTVNGWWRTGSVHIARGDVTAGLECCGSALALSPGPFDLASVKAVQGYGRVKAGELAAGVSDLEEAVAWFEATGVRYNWSLYGLRLAEGYLRQGERPRAQALLQRILASSQEIGYRYHEGIAFRLLGELLGSTEAASAAEYLDRALAIFEQVGGRNDFATTLAAKAELRRITGDGTEARSLLERSLALFSELGTLDGPVTVGAALSALTTS